MSIQSLNSALARQCILVHLSRQDSPSTAPNTAIESGNTGSTGNTDNITTNINSTNLTAAAPPAVCVSIHSILDQISAVIQTKTGLSCVSYHSAQLLQLRSLIAEFLTPSSVKTADISPVLSTLDNWSDRPDQEYFQDFINASTAQIADASHDIAPQLSEENALVLLVAQIVRSVPVTLTNEPIKSIITITETVDDLVCALPEDDGDVSDEIAAISIQNSSARIPLKAEDFLSPEDQAELIAAREALSSALDGLFKDILEGVKGNEESQLTRWVDTCRAVVKKQT